MNLQRIASKGTDPQRLQKCEAVGDLPLQTPKGAPPIIGNVDETAGSIS